MAGEWYHRPNGKQLVLGGHAINAVGYTDSYTDEWGNKGGLIVRHACTVRPGPSSAGPLCSASGVASHSSALMSSALRVHPGPPDRNGWADTMNAPHVPVREPSESGKAWKADGSRWHSRVPPGTADGTREALDRAHLLLIECGQCGDPADPQAAPTVAAPRGPQKRAAPGLARLGFV